MTDPIDQADEYRRGYVDGREGFGMFCVEPDGGWNRLLPDPIFDGEYRQGYDAAVLEGHRSIEDPDRPDPRWLW